MDKRPIGYIPGKGNPLDKKVPKSNKYQHVESSLQTGKTIKDIEVVSNHTIARRKGELFKRIKINTLFNLLKLDPAQESIYDLKNKHDTEQLNSAQEEGKTQPKQWYQQFEDNQSVQSRVTNQTQQSEATKISAITYSTQQLGITDQTTFLLLDLREPEEFQLFHIKEAINFPGHWLKRDKTIPQLFRFKNQEGKLIIIYHFDEKNGMPYGQVFAEKGFENVYLLSGGVESFLETYPECVEGTKVPVLPKKQQSSKILMRSNYREINDKQSVNFVRNPETVSQVSEVKSIKENSSQISKTTKISKTSKVSRLTRNQSTHR